MKRIFWTMCGIALGAAITYLLIKLEENDENANLPFFVMKKDKSSINDQVFAGVENDEDWI